MIISPLLRRLVEAGGRFLVWTTSIATIRSTGCNLTLPFHLTVAAETFEMYGQPV
jgi:hypothetical protein